VLPVSHWNDISFSFFLSFFFVIFFYFLLFFIIFLNDLLAISNRTSFKEVVLSKQLASDGKQRANLAEHSLSG